MSELDGREPGTVVPSLFVGIGGIGSQIVDRLAAQTTSLPRALPRQQLLLRLNGALQDIDTRSKERPMTAQDVLDRPNLRALISLLEGPIVA